MLISNPFYNLIIGEECEFDNNYGIFFNDKKWYYYDYEKKRIFISLDFKTFKGLSCVSQTHLNGFFDLYFQH